MNKDNMSVPCLEDLNGFDVISDTEKIDNQPLVTNDIYNKNMDALGQFHPELVDIVESVSINDDRVRIFDSESGNPRVVFRRDDGEEVNIHSSDDPVACANQAIDLLGKVEKEGIVVLFGFGLGYFAEELFERFEKGHILLVYEAVPEVFKLALQVRDISRLLASEQFKVILGEEADNFSVIHSHYHHIINGKFWVIRHEPSVKLNSGAYDNLFRRLNEEKNLAHMGIATNIRRGNEFMDACFFNFHAVIRKPGVTGLKNIFSGCTAIVVSAGPSLDRNIHLLKKVKGKSVIVATGGALPTLLCSGIVPDLIVEIDPVSDNIEDKFQDNPELKNIPFICLAQYTPELVNIYPGPLFMNGVEGNIVYQWMTNHGEDKGNIECFGGSVAHLAFATAEYIGADVIALLGQDLSYKSDRMHTIGYSDDLDRKLQEGAEEKQDNVLGGIPMRDIFDEEVLSIRQFIVFKTSFEKRIKASERVVINATEGGLPIEGARNMRLIDFIDEYCNGEKEIDSFSVLSGLLSRKINCNIDGIINELSMARTKFESIKTSSKQILKYTRKLKKLKGKENNESPELHHILSKVSALVEQVRHPELNLLVGYNYGLELYLKKQETQDIDEVEDKWEKLDKQLERGGLYYQEIIGSINLVNKRLDKIITALKRERKVDAILNDNTIEEKERFYRAGMIYKDAGIIAQAVRYLEDAVTEQYSEIDMSLAEMYMKQFRYYDARSILQKISDHVSGANDQNHTIAEKTNKLAWTCEKKIRAWEERKKKMGAVLKEAEAEYGSHLESGYFYFRIKDFLRAEKAYLKAISNQESGVTSQEISAACYGLAHTYLEMNDPEKAVGAIEKALDVDPSNPILYHDLGLIAAQSNNTGPAEIFFTKAIELAPSESQLYKPLAKMYMSLGEQERAAALYENAIRENEGDQAFQQDLAFTYNEMILNG